MNGFQDRPAADGEPVQLIRLGTASGFEVVFMDWGATWLSCRVPVPGRSGAVSVREVLLRSPDLEAHLRQQAYFGATIGRYANRISNGAFTLPDGSRIRLAPNEGANTLHGGAQGFDSRRWQIAAQTDTSVTFQLRSEHGDQGFPGALLARATYTVSADGTLQALFEAETSQPTPVNLTSHAYFNLAATHASALDHQLAISADAYLPVDADGIPRHGLRSVGDSSFDFRKQKTIRTDLLQDADQRLMSGYDHAYLLQPDAAAMKRPAATLIAPDRRLQLDILTDKPALQFYSGNHLQGIPGAGGSPYSSHAGIALETQFLPDAPNHPEWPHASCFLMPGEVYRFKTRFQFSSR